MRLHDYQRRMVERMRAEKRLILSVGMGLGKTVSVLTYLEETRPDSVLIVAPKRVAETVWKQEAEKWVYGFCADRMTIVRGTKTQRAKAIADVSKPYKIIGRDNLADVAGMAVDVLVLDELTSFKTVTSSRFANVMSIQALQRIGLTGTFLANGAIDIFGQCAAVGLFRCEIKKRGKWVYSPEFATWRDMYFYDAMAGSGQAFHKWRLRGKLEDVIKPIERHIFTLDSADWLEIPPVSYQVHKVTMTQDEYDGYLELNSRITVELSGEVLAFDERQKFVKLQTLCDGFCYDNDGMPVRREESSKLEAVADFCSECKEAGERVLLFYAFREEAIWLAELLKKRSIAFCSVADKRFLEKWNSGAIDVLIAHPASAGHGLNLQSGGRICVWSSITYNYEYWAQANARLARQGQTNAVQIHVFQAAAPKGKGHRSDSEQTIEERQYVAVINKLKEDKRFIDLTK